MIGDRLTEFRLCIVRLHLLLIESRYAARIEQRNLLTFLLVASHDGFALLQHDVALLVSLGTKHRHLPVAELLILEYLAFRSFLEIHEQLDNPLAVGLRCLAILLAQVLAERCAYGGSVNKLHEPFATLLFAVGDDPDVSSDARVVEVC